MTKISEKGGMVVHKNPGYLKRLMKSYENPPNIAVGFPVGKSASTQYPDGTSVVDVAFWNNYGTFNDDGSVHTPPRPFLDIGGLKIIEQTRAMRIALFQKVKEGKIKMDDAANMIGAKAAAIMKNTIRDFDTPPNAPATIAKKKSANPLVDTGLMMQSVTWEVRKKKKQD